MVAAAPIGFRIRERRRALGMTQVGLAKSLGISASYLNLIEANKRTIGGRLLQQIARHLDLDLDQLTGETERRLIADLTEAAGAPVVRQAGVDPASVADFVGRHPTWAAALLAALRYTRAQELTVAALSDRLAQDPVLADALHQVISHVTAIRATAEIIEGGEALPPETRARFDAIVGEESANLAAAAQAIVRYFDRPTASGGSGIPHEEVDDHFISHGNHFPRLEQAADAMRRALAAHGSTMDAALIDYLERRRGISVRSVAPTEADLAQFHNQARVNAEGQELVFLDNASPSTRRFHMAHMAADLFAADAVAVELAGAAVSSAAARRRAARALGAYVAGACLFPYEPFLEQAERLRYDIELLRQRYAASFEQVAHRLVTLRRPGAEGVPFGFLRADPAGSLSKRFPLPGLGIPRSGTGCPLWAIYRAFQAPDRIVRQVVQFPNRARFLFIARTVAKDPARFPEPPFLRAVMLACDTIHADRTVYADGLNLSARGIETPVGPTCRMCPRKDCLHRAEAAIVPV
ncbi:MAG: DUF2083 domain-containing protein [Alphaproteobacteria bacterium]|nr:DUF2083 domain-containing protein [Alphaproteobacteria bacterium]MCB9931373.1 DUF2083 domain-containing protein [Alphaproteobacteria bacterium]